MANSPFIYKGNDAQMLVSGNILKPDGSVYGSGSNITIQTDFGTSPVGTSFNFYSTDASVIVTGSESTDTVYFDVDWTRAPVTLGNRVQIDAKTLTFGGVNDGFLANATDPTKKFKFDLSGATTATSSSIVWSPTTARTATMPNADFTFAGTLATLGGTGQSTYTTGDLLYASATNTLAKIGIGSLGQVMRVLAGIPAWDYPGNISRVLWIGDDFLDASGTGLYGVSSTGVTGVVGVQSTAVKEHPGVRRIGTGVNIVGSAALFLNNATAPFYFGAGIFIWEAVAQVQNLSDATDTYTIIMGPYLAGGASETDSTDGAYFRYTHGTNSGKWEFKMANNSTVTTVDTGSTVDTAYHRFTIIVNANATSAQAYIDGVAAGTAITTNIPTTRKSSAGFCITKSAGTTTRELWIDAWSIFMNFTTAR